MILQTVTYLAYSLCNPIKYQFICDIFETYPQYQQGYPHFLWKALIVCSYSNLDTFDEDNILKVIFFMQYQLKHLNLANGSSLYLCWIY